MYKFLKSRRKGIFQFLRIAGGIAFITGSCLMYQVHKTINHISSVVNIKVLETEKKQAQYIYIEDPEIKDFLQLQFLNKEGIFQANSLTSALLIWWRKCRLTYAFQLMSIAMCCDCTSRLKAIEMLAKYGENLSAADLGQLAQVCDAKTAVGLARTSNTDASLFLKRPTNRLYSRQVLINRMRELLTKLNNKREHECLTYFLSKTFPGSQNNGGMGFNLDIRGKVIQTGLFSDDILPKCVKEVAHYCNIEDNALEFLDAGGLQLLMDVYQHLGSENAMDFARMLENISLYPEYLNHIFATGWIYILAQLSRNPDKRISTRAIHTLANLDSDDMFHASYGPQVLLLHPSNRSFITNNCVDVVFVHGLLGGALVTWCQRDVGIYQLSFYDLQSPVGTSVEPPKRKRLLNVSDTATQEYLSAIQDLKQEEWDKLGEDYEFVFSDFPVDMNNVKGSFSIPGTSSLVKTFLEEEGKKDYSSCWPLDWLSKDCPDSRILSVNYDTRLSDWQFNCLRGSRRDIDTISDSLMEELVSSGVGQRPVIWVVHSMGGLIVKSMIVKAWKRIDKCFQDFQRNTKGIVFLSTPHFGSHIASMFDTHRTIFWPSNEVDDLRVNSKFLRDLHKKFLQWLKEFPSKIPVVTIVETKPTQFAGLGFWVEFMFVPPESADPGFGEVYYLPYDHVNICKPTNRLSFIYQKILDIVKNTMKEKYK